MRGRVHVTDRTTLYVSIESKTGHLVIDGPLALLCELLALLREPGQHDQMPADTAVEVRDA
jgi:hypothetical protein